MAILSEKAVRNLEMSLTCPRKAFLTSELPGGTQKYRHLSKIFFNIMDTVPINAGDNMATRKMVADQVNTEFGLANMGLLPFEERSEKIKMYHIILRYLRWEEGSRMKDVIASDFKEVVSFCGKQTEAHVQRLIDRGDFYEAVSYAYKRPDLKNSGRRFQTQKEHSVRLLLLKKAGDKMVQELQQTFGMGRYPLKPVYGSIYYMRSGMDNKSFDPFNDHHDQIVSHSFTPVEERDIELIYSKVQVGSNATACNPSDCYGCQCAEICQTVFVPKKEVKLPPPEIKPINEIHLTKAQEAFVAFRKGEARVNAVAGSGKTTIITLRTISLLEEGVRPEEIWMVTFTDKACGEMRERISRYMKGSALNNLNLDIDKLTITTFNSWGQMQLNENYDKLGFTAPPVVIDDITKKDILIDLLKVHDRLPLNYNEPFLNTKYAHGAVVEIGALIDTMKSCDVKTAGDVEKIPRLHSTLRRHAAELLAIYNEYNNQLVQRNLIDYEDQMRLLLVLEQYGVFSTLPYRHIVVDEFQDTDANQINLLREIKAKAPHVESLAVVGDEMQAIYGFRNASPENLIEFGKYFPNMKDYFLSENFRSQAPIIGLANSILSKEARIKQAIKAQRTASNVQPVIITKNDREDEIAFIVKVTQDWINSGIKPSSIAVLGRSRSELAAYERALNKVGVDTILRVPEIVRDNAYVKAILAFAKWMHDDTQMLSLALYAKMLGQDPFDIKALNESAEKVKQAFSQAKDEEEKYGLFFSFVEPAREDYIADFFLHELEDKHFKTLAQVVEYCVKYDAYGIREQHSTAKEESEAVTLITVHSAKGLEYDNVITSMRPYRESSEEKRVLYVAITRAKERLIITTTEKQSLNRLLRD